MGSYFTSGHALAIPNLDDFSEFGDYLKKRTWISKTLIDTIITFPKILMVALNGNAIGFGATSTMLADFVYSVPGIQLRTPFMELGLCVEGCSSVTFPRNLGSQRANSMLFLGQGLTAEQWKEAGAINDIFPRDQLLEKVLEKAHQLALYAPDAVSESLKLIRAVDRELLLAVNEKEMLLLIERLQSETFQTQILAFMSAIF